MAGTAPDFSIIPSIEQLRQRPAIRALEARFGSGATVDALREAATAVRRAIKDRDEAPPAIRTAVIDQIEAATLEHLTKTFRPSLAAVINATGVVLHTNLGRAPL